MKILIIIALFCFLLLLIVCTTIYSKKKADKIVYKINEAKDTISEYLDRNIAILDSSKEYINDDAYSESYDNIFFGGMSSKETYQITCRYNSKLREKIMENEELIKNKDFCTLIDELDEVNSYVEGAIKYYSFYVDKYKEIFNKFPAKFIKFLCHYKKFHNYKEIDMSTL